MRRRKTAISAGLLAIFALALGAQSASAAPPKILKTGFSAVKTDSAILEAKIDLGEKATSYRFQHGTADCSSNPCTTTAKKDLLVKDGLQQEVQLKIEGLSAATTYHFRVLAENEGGKNKVESPDRTLTTHAAPSPFGSCSNDLLRKENPSAHLIDHSSANLPDCRAYEQASPVEKNGADVTGVVSTVKASANGDSVSFNTMSSIPGGEGAQAEFPFWLSSRGADGWSTQGLLPPASAGEGVRVRGWTPDFSQVFHWARRLGPPETAAFLSRSSADRSLSEIAPYGSVGTKDFPDLAGASADGSVVVFESTGKLTSKAVEGKSNVYAWERDTGELHLASVLPDSECGTPPCAPPEGAFAGPYNWIGQAATAVKGDEVLQRGGSGIGHYTQDQRVLSADGSRLYFTAAGTGQLYLRENPTEPGATTVRVSASQRTTPDSAGARPAAFMAATPDGSKAFFTSPEKLTNDANTGPEQDPPTIGRSDIDGDPGSVELDFMSQRAAGMAVEDEYLYWAIPSEDAIGRAKLNGAGDATEVQEKYVTGADNPQYVAVDDEHLYWTNAADEEDGNGSIGRAKLGATEGEEVKQDYVTGAHNPQGIAVDATYVYWANGGSELETRTIGRAKLGASEAEEVEQEFIQVDSGSQAFVPQGLAINATHVYATINGFGPSGFVFRYDLGGDPDSWIFFFDVLHEGPFGVRGIALDANFVYWAREDGDTVGRINLNLEGASADREFIKDAGRPFGVAHDGAHLYWSANQEVNPNPGNDLYRYDAETGDLTDLTVDAGSEAGAEVKGVLGASADGSYVYFAANGVLAPGAEPGNCEGSANLGDGLAAFTGQCSLYLAHEGDPIGFIARLDAAALGVGGGDAANWLPGGTSRGGLQKTSRVSADGRTLLFRSKQKLTAYDNEGVPQLYRYRVGEGIACVSCNPTGEAPTNAPGYVPGYGSVGPSFLFPTSVALVLSRNFSADGNRVFFETAEALVPGDTNGDEGCPIVGSERFKWPACQDVYQWEVKGTGSCEADVQGGGCLYLLSSGKDPHPSYFADASASGDDAFLITRAKLVGQDQDQLYDVYDAKLGGGLLAQNELPTVCEGEACRPGATPAPSSQSAGSSSFSGPGNAKEGKPKPRCAKGKRKVRAKGKTRCVAKQRKRGKQRKRHDKTTRRASR